MPYLTNAGPQSGPIPYRDTGCAIDVLQGRGGKVIGSATCVGWIQGGESLWRLTIDGAALPGLWVVFDGEFRPA
jgi:hypothetical protein